MSSLTSAEEQHRLRLLRGDNYQGSYQPQWVRLTADKVQAFDAGAATKKEVEGRERSVSESSVKSDDSTKSAEAEHIELAGFKGIRLL